MKIKINMLSKATSAPAQGVGSAYLEQTELVKDISDLQIEINSKKSNFDIYHIHSVNPTFRMRMNKKHINIVYVHFVPSKNDGSIKLPKLISKIFDKYVNSFYKKADELVVVNPSFTKPLLDLGIKRDKITYIPNYVDTKNFFKLSQIEINKLKEKYQLPKDKFIVLGVGQIQTRKGVDDFIKTAIKNPDKEFVWAGGFSFGKITDGYKKYKQIIENHPQNVHFLGILPREEMNGVYNIADVLFMPSYIELFPMAVLEACKINKPILLRDLELYKPILFNKYCCGKNVEEFSLEINKLSNEKLYYENRVNDSKFIADFYNKDAVKKAWEDYYKRIYKKYHQNS